MLYVLLAFFGVFLLVVCGWLLLFYRESMADRVTAVITPNLKKDSFKSQLEKTGLIKMEGSRLVMIPVRGRLRAFAGSDSSVPFQRDKRYSSLQLSQRSSK